MYNLKLLINMYYYYYLLYNMLKSTYNIHNEIYKHIYIYIKYNLDISPLDIPRSDANLIYHQITEM